MISTGLPRLVEERRCGESGRQRRRLGGLFDGIFGALLGGGFGGLLDGLLRLHVKNRKRCNSRQTNLNNIFF
jgi:hypothetical protein